MEMTELAFPGTSIPGYRIKLVFLLASAVCASIFILHLEWGGKRWQGEGDIKTWNSKALYGVNVRITFVPAAYHEALKRRCSFPIPDLQSQPGAATSDLCSGISCSYFWVLLLTDPAISEQLKGAGEVPTELDWQQHYLGNVGRAELCWSWGAAASGE